MSRSSRPPGTSARQVARWHWLSIASLIALIALALAWELVIAPLRPGGSLLALKALPLLVPLFGILRGRRYTYQWAPMLVLAYFAEGVMRGYGDGGPGSLAGWSQATMAVVFIVAAAYYARDSRRLQLSATAPAGQGSMPAPARAATNG
ncbi:MAG: DUF2069 domain-containing protein [Proteobacteria bacterium]|nr:DUF2069 domain-containing protein [Burkholderiales bacterium]